MSTRMSALIMLLILLSPAAAAAGSPQAAMGRIDIYAVDQAIELRPAGASPGATVGFCPWLGEGRERTGLTSEARLQGDWQQLWLAFVPQADGEVDIDFQSEWYQRSEPGDVRLVWVDDAAVDGAEIANAGFEAGGPDGTPADWRFTSTLPAERYSRDGTVARTGRACVAVWYGGQARQAFRVEAGRTYRVSAWFRALDPDAIPGRSSHVAAVPEDTYGQEVILTFARPEAAEQAAVDVAPLYKDREWSVSARWDDNNTNDLKMRDVMEEHGYRGTFYLNGDQGWYGPDAGSMDPTELGRRLLSGGNSVGGHSMTHPFLTYLNRNRQFWEVMAVRMLWEARLDRPVNTYAFSFCDFRNAAEGNAVQAAITECLRRAGYLGTPNGWFHDQMDTEMILLPILPSDGDPIEATAESWLVDPGRRATNPNMSFSMHVWYSTPEAWDRFAGQLDAYGRRPRWWYCNQSQYAAYRWEATHTTLGAGIVEDRSLAVPVRRPTLAELGDPVPLTLRITRTHADDLEEASCDGTPLQVQAGRDGALLVELPHAADQKTPMRIGRRDNPTNAQTLGDAHEGPDFPGIRALLSRRPAGLSMALANESGAPLRNVAVTYRLPPAYRPGVVRKRLPDVVGTQSDLLALEPAVTDYKLLAGRPFYAAQLDFEWRGEPARLHLSCTAPPAERDASWPQGGFMVTGPLTEAQLVGLVVTDVARGRAPALTWHPERSDQLEVLDPEVIATSGQWRAPDGGRQCWLLRSIVVSDRNQEVGFTGDSGGIRALFLNGAELPAHRGRLRTGNNELIVVAQGTNGGFGRSNAGCFLRITEPESPERAPGVEFVRPD